MSNSLVDVAETRLKTALSFYGWYEGRRVSVADWLTVYRNDTASEPFPMATSFLQEFGGLQFGCYPSKYAQYAVRQVILNPHMGGLGSADYVRYWDTLVQRRTFPIGELDGYPMIITEDGEIYYDSAGDGKRVGHTVEEALAVLLLRETRPVLVFPHMLR